MAKVYTRVTYDKSADNWRVSNTGSQRASYVTSTKYDAVSKATNIARNQHNELVIHNKDGKIASRNSYGNDPYPPKG